MPTKTRKTRSPEDQAAVENAFRPELHDVVGVPVEDHSNGQIPLTDTLGKNYSPENNSFHDGSYHSILNVSDIGPSPTNPRKRFDSEALQELAASIKEHGLIEPLVVRPNPRRLESGAPEFELIAGERRWRACQLAGVTEVPVMLRQADDRQALELALIENLQRRDIDPIEEAQGYQALASLGYTQAQIGQRVGRNQPSVAKALSLVELPDRVKELIQTREITPSHGTALRHWKKFPAVQAGLAQIAIERKLSSHDLDDNRAVLNYAHLLSAAGVITQIEYNFPSRHVCIACPFGAYVKSEWGSPYCLKPEHYQELLEQVEAERAAKAEEVTAQLRESDPDLVPESGTLPDMAGMKYDSYEVCDRDVPAGCSKECECRRAALKQGVPIQICIDPKRFKSLRTQQTKQANKALREKTKALSEKCLSVLAERDDAPFLSLLAAMLLHQNPSLGAVEGYAPALARYGSPCISVGEAKDGRINWEQERTEAWRKLSTAGVSPLLRAGMDANFKRYLAELSQQPSEPKRFQTFLELLPPVGERTLTDADDGPLQLTCAGCGTVEEWPQAADCTWHGIGNSDYCPSCTAA